MLDHLTLGVSNFAAATAFYDQALAPLGIRQLVAFSERVKVVGYGNERAQFWIADENPTRGKLHLAFVAKSRELVDAFHAAALAAGGRDNGAPGLRAHYSADYYGAFVLDPDGHNIEAVCRRAG